MTRIEKLAGRVAALDGKEDGGEFHSWLHRDADCASWLAVMEGLTSDERMLLARAIKILSEGNASVESLPEPERTAWTKAYSLYEKLKQKE